MRHVPASRLRHDGVATRFEGRTLRVWSVLGRFAAVALPDRAAKDRIGQSSAIVFFTVSTSCFKLKGLGMKPKSSPSGRFRAKASSA